jgi:formate hydrogenlyase subunit 3/multisubunit Na+/H+ antiporter MnhD subunit
MVIEISLLANLIPFIISFFISLWNRRAGYLAVSVSSILVMIYTLTGTLTPLALLKVLALASWFLLSLTSRDDMSTLLSVSVIGMLTFMDSGENLFLLIAGWEVMALPLFYAFKEIRPSVTFFAFGELSTVLLIGGAAISGGNMDNLSETSVILLLSGFLVKTGITPFYGVDWLPLQEGKLPHSLSSLVSATMTLMGIYGALQVLQQFSVPLPMSYALILLGSFTAFMASLYGYVSDDGRASLAFSSIENSGAMITSLGVYTLGGVTREVALASLLMIAISNSIGKTGAFLTSISSLTYNKPFQKRWESYLGSTMIAASLSGLLPTAGGVGSWGLLETLFISAYVSGILGVVPLIGGVLIASAEGFATALAIKYFSSRHIFRKGELKDSDWPSRFISGIAVLLSGVSLSYLVYPFKGGLLGVASGTLIETFSNKPFGGISPLYVLIMASVGSLLTLALLGRPKGRKVKTWNNGVDKEDDYTPFAMANNERVMLKFILGDGKFSKEVFTTFFLILSRKYKNFSDLLARAIFNGNLTAYVAYLAIAFIIILIVTLL